MKITLKRLLNEVTTDLQKPMAERFTKSAQVNFNIMLGKRANEITELENRLELMSHKETAKELLEEGTSEKYIKKRAEMLIELTIAKREYEVLEKDKWFYE